MGLRRNAVHPSLMTPTQITLAIAFAIGLATGAAGAWRWQSVRIAEKTLELTHERLDRANERIGLQQAARATSDRLASQVIKAQNEAAARTAAIRRDADLNRTELERLRLASADAVRAAAASLDACVNAVHAFDLISTQCAARLVEVARDADGFASDSLTLQQAWPK